MRIAGWVSAMAKVDSGAPRHAKAKIVNEAVTLIQKLILTLTLYRGAMKKFLRPALFLVLLSGLIPGVAIAAPKAAPTPPPAQATLMKPLTLSKTADMNFGDLTVTTGGTATIDPNTGLLSVAGGLLAVGGSPSPGRFTGAASRLALILIRTPTSVLLKRSGGTETLTLDTFTLDGFFIRLVGATPYVFAVGGQLHVPSGTVDGTYVGQVDVTVEYF